MLTLEINDAGLEQKILAKARAIGKSAQELINDMIYEKIQAEEATEALPFEVPKLDYKKYVRPYEPELTEDGLLLAEGTDVKPFSHVTDTIEYALQLRKNAWKRP